VSKFQLETYFFSAAAIPDSAAEYLNNINSQIYRSVE